MRLLTTRLRIRSASDGRASVEGVLSIICTLIALMTLRAFSLG